MKKLVSLLLVLCMVLTLLCACGATIDTTVLEEGIYDVLDDDEVVAVLVSTGKKLTVYDEDGEDGEILMEETKFKYDEDEAYFTIDGDEAFTLTADKKTLSIEIPKKSPLNIKKGEYTLAAAGSSDDDGDTPSLEKGTYVIYDEDDEPVGYLEWTGKKITVTGIDGEELLEESKFAYDEKNGCFTIDDEEAFSLEVGKKKSTLIVPKKSPLGLDKGEYTLESVEEDELPTVAASDFDTSDWAIVDFIMLKSGRTLYVALPEDLAQYYDTHKDSVPGSYNFVYSSDSTTDVSVDGSSSYLSLGFDIDDDELKSYLETDAENGIYIEHNFTVIEDSDVMTETISGITFYQHYAVWEANDAYWTEFFMIADDGTDCIEVDMTYYSYDSTAPVYETLEMFKALASTISIQ